MHNSPAVDSTALAALLCPRACARAPAAMARKNKDKAAEARPDEAKPARSLGPLRMIWRAAKVYPGHIVIAFCALVTTATATLGIPWGFRQIIDKGFAKEIDPKSYYSLTAAILEKSEIDL